MACHFFGAKPLSKEMLDFFELDPYEQNSVKFNHNTNFFIHENESANIVC